MPELSLTQLSVAELLNKPGASRPLASAYPIPAGIDFDLTELHEDVRLEGVIESVVEGILIRGTATTHLVQTCGRCLEPLHPLLQVQFAELFRDPAKVEPDDEVEEGYVIAGDQTVDLDMLLRDALAEGVHPNPLCRIDCAGLCPQCGTNRNHGTCDCRDDDVDPRWTVLSQLDLPS